METNMHKNINIIIAWILALISVLPLLFIAWLSILHAEDINQSVFFPQSINNKVTFFVPQDGNSLETTEIAATSLGHVYSFSQSSNYRGEKMADINSMATVYAQDKSSLWAFSANKGLIEINMKNGSEKNSYDWNFFKGKYANYNPFRFSFSSDILPEHFAWLGDRLNDEPAFPSSKDSAFKTVSSLVGIKFFHSEEIIGQLNFILANKNKLDQVLNYWKKWDGWLNPQIHKLFKIKNPSEKDRHLLFRFCLSELFPNKISRLKYFSWQDIWVSQVANHGLSVLSVDDKIIMGIRGESFPGIAIFDTETKEVSWITEAMGLPSASIQNIVKISNHEILAVHDVGLSIIQFQAEKITHNFLFGEYGLPYLDEQNLRIKTLPNNKISISYGTANLIFDFLNFKTENAGEQESISSLISSYYENSEGYKWLGYSDGRIEVLDNSGIPVWASEIPKGKRSFQWSNYQDIMKIMPLAAFIKNSVLISISISLLCTLLAIFPSYAIARLKFFGKAFFARVMLSSQVLSSLPFLIPIFVIFIILQMKSFQVFNNFAAIILVNTAFFLPLTVQFLFNMFKALPASLEESAMMDGCTPWQTFWKIIMPIALPALITCLIYIFLFAWDEILFIWILSTDSITATLPVGIRLAAGQLVNRPDLLMAFSVIASIPPMLLFAFAQPFLLKSLTKRNR
jgi:ABC-type glycerol-3-phosphate transport system permease component